MTPTSTINKECSPHLCKSGGICTNCSYDYRNCVRGKHQNCTTSSPHQETKGEWEERFDSNFVEWTAYKSGSPAGIKIRNFIRQTLATQKAELLTKLIETLEGEKQPNQEVSEYYSGYNSAISRIKELTQGE